MESIQTDLLGPADTAKRLGITPQRVVQLANEGRIKCFRTSIGRLFRAADVEELAEKRQAGTRRKR